MKLYINIISSTVSLDIYVYMHKLEPPLNVRHIYIYIYHSRPGIPDMNRFFDSWMKPEVSLDLNNFFVQSKYVARQHGKTDFINIYIYYNPRISPVCVVSENAFRRNKKQIWPLGYFLWSWHSSFCIYIL